MSAFSKFYHHQLCDSVPFPLWFAIISRIHFFSDPGPKNDHLPGENLLAQIEMSLALDSHSCSLSLDRHEMSLNIDMKMIRPLNSSGSSLIFEHELLDFVAELQCGESWENIPLEFHWLTINCIQSSVMKS